MTLCSFASFSNGDPIKSSRRLNNSVHCILRSTLRDRTYWARILPTIRMQRSRERIHHREQTILVVMVRQAQRTRNEEVEPQLQQARHRSRRSGGAARAPSVDCRRSRETYPPEAPAPKVRCRSYRRPTMRVTRVHIIRSDSVNPSGGKFCHGSDERL